MTEIETANYREQPPQLEGRLFLTDGGMETSLVFHEGWELPMFASFVLLESEAGRAALRRYFDKYLPFALEQKAGFILESPTWRANPEWGARLGYSLADLERVNRDAVAFMRDIQARYETEACPMPISGCIGPRGDGYQPGEIMGVAEATDYHAWQIGQFVKAGADFVTAMTLNNVNEALGFVLAAKRQEMPSVVSLTVETDGKLPTGESLAGAIEAIDEASAGAPLYYMINCAHPTHFEHVLEAGAGWVQRLGGIRANSSRCSHEELDNAEELDVGNPQELGQQYRQILAAYPHITVIGGCCGTDHRHIREIWHACNQAA